MPDELPPKENPTTSTWKQIGKYSHLAIALPAATVAGWLVGSLLDRWLHTTWIYIVGLTLGSVAGLIELIRVATKDSE